MSVECGTIRHSFSGILVICLFESLSPESPPVHQENSPHKLKKKMRHIDQIVPVCLVFCSRHACFMRFVYFFGSRMHELGMLNTTVQSVLEYKVGKYVFGCQNTPSTHTLLNMESYD
jgi:hypothetical protein